LQRCSRMSNNSTRLRVFILKSKQLLLPKLQQK
jgi:hypothetical protein